MNFAQIVPIMIGSMIILTRLPIVIYPTKTIKVFMDMMEDKNLPRLLGGFNTVLGLFLMLMFEYYVSGIYLIIPLIGALVFLVGVSLMWVPEIVYKKLVKPILKSGDARIRFFALIGVILGAYLVWLGCDY